MATPRKTSPPAPAGRDRRGCRLGLPGLLLALSLWGCSGAGGPDGGSIDVALTDTALTPDVTVAPDPAAPCTMPLLDELDVSPGGLSSFALSFGYRCWVADEAIHPSAGPHAETGPSRRGLVGIMPPWRCWDLSAVPPASSRRG